MRDGSIHEEEKKIWFLLCGTFTFLKVPQPPVPVFRVLGVQTSRRNQQPRVTRLWFVGPFRAPGCLFPSCVLR